MISFNIVVFQRIRVFRARKPHNTVTSDFVCEILPQPLARPDGLLLRLHTAPVLGWRLCACLLKVKDQRDALPFRLVFPTGCSP